MMLVTRSSIPASYRVLFMQGGGTTQFSAVPLNLCATPQERAQYLVTGAWSQAAQQEATKYAQAAIIDARASPSSPFTTLPSVEAVRSQIDPTAAYVYACANETVHGVEWGPELEQLFSPAPAAAAATVGEAEPAPPASAGPVLVSDMSSSFMSQPVDVSRYGLIYAGAQKNVGGAGVTIVVVRDSLLRKHPAQPSTPLMLQYALQADKGSMYNTPPTFSIYITGLVFKWLLAQGGLGAIGERNAAKARLLYGAIDASQGFYRAFVAGPHRSRMNVVFTVAAASDPQARDDKLNAAFVKQAEARGLVGLAGHRSVGGLRASLYNAVSMEAVQALVDFMKHFQTSQQA